MNLIGTKRGGRHLHKNVNGKNGSDGGINIKTPKPLWKKLLKTVLLIFSIAVLTGAGWLTYLWFSSSDAMPDISEDAYINPFAPREYDPDNPHAVAPPKMPGAEDSDYTVIRDKTKFTFLIFGIDGGGGLTDVIMTATFDSANYTLNVVSIPRDTLVNVGWSEKKANTIHSNMQYRYRGQEDAEDRAMQSTIDYFADILGYRVDSWIKVDFEAFKALVNAVGHIEFDIPVDMKYSDPHQNLHIDFKKGLQLLDGDQALKVLRFRSGYANRDLGRINTQQDFLAAAVKQILEKKDSLNPVTLADIFIRHVKTDLPLSTVVWLAREFFKLDAENVIFDMMPVNGQDAVNARSYASIYINEWLEMLNEMLNPFTVEITETDVSILTRNANRRLYVTDDNWKADRSWGR